jgi:hypothetical protein
MRSSLAARVSWSILACTMMAGCRSQQAYKPASFAFIDRFWAGAHPVAADAGCKSILGGARRPLDRPPITAVHCQLLRGIL